MKAETGCMCPGDEPPGPYSTNTPFMLLPGTFGSTWSNTTVTLDLVESLAEAGARASVASMTLQRTRVSICFSLEFTIVRAARTPIVIHRFDRLAGTVPGLLRRHRTAEPGFERHGPDMRVGGAGREGLVV